MEGLPVPWKAQGPQEGNLGVHDPLGHLLCGPLTDWLVRMEEEEVGEFCQGDTFIHQAVIYLGPLPNAKLVAEHG